MSWINNLKKRGLKDILNPKKWFIYTRYLKSKVAQGDTEKDPLAKLKKEYDELTIPEYIEQIIVRMKSPECKRCLVEGECYHCGCKSPELFYDKSNWCSGDAWFQMMPPKEWQNYKKEMQLNISQEEIDFLLKTGKIKLEE